MSDKNFFGLAKTLKTFKYILIICLTGVRQTLKSFHILCHFKRIVRFKWNAKSWIDFLCKNNKTNFIMSATIFLLRALRATYSQHYLVYWNFRWFPSGSLYFLVLCWRNFQVPEVWLGFPYFSEQERAVELKRQKAAILFSVGTIEENRGIFMSSQVYLVEPQWLKHLWGHGNLFKLSRHG